MKKVLLLIGILIIGVIVFNSSCSSVVKEPSTVRFTELDKEIQDTLFAIWYHDYKKVTVDTEYVESINEYWVHETTAPIDFIDFTNNYVLERKQNRILPWVNDKVVINKSNGWKHTFPSREYGPIIIKGDKIYTPTIFYFYGVASKSEMDTCRFNVYTIKD
jgi:hypothetical protein